MLAQHFSKKMTVPHLYRVLTSLPVVTGVYLTDLTTTEADVCAALSALVETKAVGPDGTSPRLLCRCSSKLARSLTRIFDAILRQNKWPRMWKVSNVVTVYKKGSRLVPSNYRAVSLLSVLEGIIASNLTRHLESQYLFNASHFSFRKEHSSTDLNLLLVSERSDSLGQEKLTAALIE